MKELNLPKKANGFIYTIKSIDIKTIKCPTSCIYTKPNTHCYNDCSKKRYWPSGIIVGDGEIKAIQCLINVKNVCDKQDWVVDADDALMVDTDGYIYKGVILCENCLPFRVVEDRTKVHPQSQVDYIQLFPLLETVDNIAKIRVNINHEWVDFQIADDVVSLFDNIECVDNNIIKSVQDADRFPNDNIVIGTDYDSIRFDVQRMNSDINGIKLCLYSRFNNILSASEKTKLENRINNELYRLNLDLHSKTDCLYDEVKEALDLVEQEYKEKIAVEKDALSEMKNIDKKIKELLALSPREFEEYVGELFTCLGYKVEVTPYVNDKGVDIIMYKGAVKYGVQCKRYKGTVGSPEIQTFIGALDHAKADKGFFVTTGMFSFEAEKMAVQHPIQLINKVELSELIMEALKK